VVSELVFIVTLPVATGLVLVHSLAWVKSILSSGMPLYPDKTQTRIWKYLQLYSHAMQSIWCHTVQYYFFARKVANFSFVSFLRRQLY